MENLKVMKITNKKQFEKLVEILENHPAVAKGLRYAENCKVTNYTQVWDEVTDKLNSLGPPVRDVLGWQKVWNDIKLKTKKKLAHNKREINATGGGPNKLKYISNIEESISSLLSLDRTVNCPGRICGLPLTQNSTELEDIVPEQDSVDVSNPHGKQVEHITEPSLLKEKTKTSSKNDYRRTLLEKQTEKTSYLANQLKEIKYDIKKLVKIKEQKLKIAKEREEREKSEAVLKKEILLLKKKRN